ncbi:MAG: hypothetical protein IJJ14_03750 [Coriobacteriales bacterium]|nr:hypothetical protein [Coriobacteriales bacterium]
MEYTLRDTGINKKRIYVHLSKEEVEKEIEQAHIMMAYQKNIKVDAKSDVKRLLLDKMDFGEYMMVLKDTIMDRIAPFAITEHKLCLIGRYKCQSDWPVVMGKPYDFSILCTTKPTYELRDYSPVEVTMPEFKISDSDLQGAMASFAERASQMVADGARKKVISGDNIEIKMETVCNGKKVRNLSSDKRSYVVGQGLMPEQFDKNIIGMLVGETKEFSFTAPAPVPDKDGKQYDAEYQVTATVLAICKKVVPAITDRWVKDNVEGCETVEDLQNRMRDELRRLRGAEYDDQLAGACASELGKRLVGSIPDDLFEIVYGDLAAQFDAQLEAQGTNRTEWIKNNNVDEQQFMMMLMFQAREQLVQGFALDAWARHYELEPEEEDYKMVYSSAAPGQEELYKREMAATGNQYLIDEMAMRFRANRHLVDTARISVE